MERAWKSSIEMAARQIKSNIYLAKVTRVELSLQAAFVEYGATGTAFAIP